MLNSKSIIERKQNIMASDMDGDIVMMNIETGKYYNLGKIGGLIWNMTEYATSISDLVDKLTNEFDVTKEQCEKDILPFLEKMLEQKLIFCKN
jgi:Coenzyme PQQ synthesis protein D (PqqD).